MPTVVVDCAVTDVALCATAECEAAKSNNVGKKIVFVTLYKLFVELNVILCRYLHFQVQRYWFFSISTFYNFPCTQTI